jgi:hypothetical protein
MPRHAALGRNVQYRLISSSAVGLFTQPLSISPPLDESWVKDVLQADSAGVQGSLGLGGGFRLDLEVKKPPPTYVELLPQRLAVMSHSIELTAGLAYRAYAKLRDWLANYNAGDSAQFSLVGLNTELEIGPFDKVTTEWLADRFVAPGLTQLPKSATLLTPRVQFVLNGIDEGHRYAVKLEPRSTDLKWLFVSANDEIRMPADGASEKLIRQDLKQSLTDSYHRIAKQLGRMLLDSDLDEGERKEDIR